VGICPAQGGIVSRDGSFGGYEAVKGVDPVIDWTMGWAKRRNAANRGHICAVLPVVLITWIP